MQISTAFFPDNSLDWRFFLPITPEIKILIVGHECENIYQHFLRLGIASVYYCTDNMQLPVVDSGTGKDQQSRMTFAELELRSDLLSFFDVVVFPHGLVQMEFSNSKVRQPPEFHFVKKFMRSGGVLLVSFANGLFFKQKKLQSGYYYSYVWKMKSMLKKNGYDLTSIYGAIPDQFVPEYIFPLTIHSIGFILRSRYKDKIPSLLLPCLTNSVLTKIIANFFPAYFIVATASF